MVIEVAVWGDAGIQACTSASRNWWVLAAEVRRAREKDVLRQLNRREMMSNRGNA